MDTKEIRRCADCGCPISGRKDRRFCSDSCRVNFHNTRVQNEKPIIRKVNKVLKFNRAVLEKLYHSGVRQITRFELELQGFHFAWHTGSIEGKMRILRFYEFLLLPIDDETVEIRTSEFFDPPVS